MLLALVAGLALRPVAQYRLGFGAVGSHDFIEYWSAARLLQGGANPYHPTAVLAMEQAAGWPEVSITTPEFGGAFG